MNFTGRISSPVEKRLYFEFTFKTTESDYILLII